MKLYAWCAAAPLVLAGCSDSDGPDVDEPGARTISAADALTLRGADGAMTSYPLDLDRAVVQTYAHDENGDWHVYAGEGSSAGTLSVERVPAGDGWLRVDYFDASPEPVPRNEYFRLGGEDDVALDLGTWRTGRVPTFAGAGTQVRLDLSNLAPWVPGLDLAVIYAPNVGFVNVFREEADGIAGIPEAGETASALEVAWAEAVGGPLIQAARGDHAYAMQFRFRDVGDDLFLGVPVRAMELPAFTVIDGGATTVPAAFPAPTSPLRVRVAMDRDAFDAYQPAVGRTPGPAFGRGFAISASPTAVTQDFSRGSLPAELLVLDGPNTLEAGGLLDLGDADIASPFPADHVFGTFITGYPVVIPRDDGFPAQCTAQIGVLTTALPTAEAPARPIISPVTGVTIAGQAAFDSPQGVGLTPEIRWLAPALGTPSEYEVRILAPGGADLTYGGGWYPSAIFHVPGDETSLQLPPEILLDDRPYALAIRAITSPLTAEERAAAPRKLALPYGWADTLTPSFHP